jgi:hypothetical protein
MREECIDFHSYDWGVLFERHSLSENLLMQNEFKDINYRYGDLN